MHLLDGAYAGDAYRDIHQLHPEGIPYQVVGKDYSALQARIRPFRAVWICDVEPDHSSRQDLVLGSGDHPLDDGLLLVGDALWHIGRG